MTTLERDIVNDAIAPGHSRNSPPLEHDIVNDAIALGTPQGTDRGGVP